MRAIVLAIFGFVLVTPQLTAAQGLVACTGTNCNFCSLAQTVDNVISFLIALMVIIAVILLAYAGLRIATSAGDTSRVKEGKQLFFNVVIGLVIILASWMIVDTLLKALTGSDMGVWNPVDCGGIFQPLRGIQPYVETRLDQVDYVGTISGVSTPAGDASLAGGGMSDSIARSLLTTAGIELKDGVSLQGVQPHVINQLAALDQACNCNILVTSVTDGTHAAGTFSHANGFKADLRTYDNPQLVSYVQSLPYSNSWRDGTRTYYDAAACATYAVESDHIDVVYKTGC